MMCGGVLVGGGMWKVVLCCLYPCWDCILLCRGECVGGVWVGCNVG